MKTKRSLLVFAAALGLASSLLLTVGCPGTVHSGKPPDKKAARALKPPDKSKIVEKDGPLPPDPGADGLKTFAGMDSDNDGVRDDLQRLIAEMEPNIKDRRSALRQLTMTLQAAIETAEDKYTASEHMSDFSVAYNCFVFVHLDKNEKDYEKRTEFTNRISKIEALLANSKERARAYIKANASASGGSF